MEWPTVGLIFACHFLWFVAVTAGWHWSPPLSVCLLSIAIALQSSLMHEVLHGHPTRSAVVNEVLVGLPVGLVYPYRRFKAQHLRHHADERLTDPFDDPESYYRAFWQHEAMPAWLRALLVVNNTMVGRVLIGPALANAAFAVTEWRLLRGGDRAVAVAWRNHLIGLCLLAAVWLAFLTIPLWAYLLAAYLGQSIIAIRTFAEHQWSERPDGRTIIVERSPLSLLFLNNNLHLVHHKMPTLPWYQLPRAFAERREEWLRMNGSYVFRNYLALLRSFAFKAKEPVAHPVLRRRPEPGRAFRPRIRARGVSRLGSAPVPAEPPRE